MNNNVEAVIFDMDGTLVNNMQYHRDAWISFFHQHKIEIDDQKFSVQDLKPATEMVEKYFSDRNPSVEEIQSFAEDEERTYREHYKPHIEEVKGLTPLLQELNQRGIKVGLATMENIPNINFILDELNIRNYFQVITDGSEVTEGKPNPEVFLKTIDKLQVKKQNCRVIEDSLGGVIAALDAGIEVIGITTTYTEKELLERGCCFTIEDFNDKKLLQLFGKLFKY